MAYATSMKLTVRDIMTEDVFAVARDTSLGTAVRMLSDRAITGAPVIDGEARVVGVISRSDLFDCYRKSSTPGKPVYFRVTNDELVILRDEGPPRAGVVDDVMSRFVLSISPDRTVIDAVRLMVADEVHRLLVVEDHRVVGIITSMDVMKALVEKYEQSKSEG